MVVRGTHSYFFMGEKKTDYVPLTAIKKTDCVALMAIKKNACVPLTTIQKWREYRKKIKGFLSFSKDSHF